MSHFTRRHLLQQQVFGLAGLAAAWVQQQAAQAEPPKPTLEPVVWNLQPKLGAKQPTATAMISMFMQGGPSHIDLFDPKPELNRLHMQTYTGSIKYDNAGEASSRLFGCPWRFRKYGECGMDFSEPAAALGEVADDICMIRSMHTGVNNHGESINALNTGRQLSGRPALGAWLTFALGSRNSQLPGFLVLTDPGGLPVLGVENWQNGWLPSVFQGTVVRPQEPRILNLDPPAQLVGTPQSQMLRLIADLNARHLSRYPGESDLSARMQSYELAAGMQTAAREALEISQETQATQRLYGLDNDTTREYGTRCLIARRLVERGVRFIQLHTGNQTWDHHGGIIKSLPAVCARTIPPAAALVKDLKQRGLLDSTIVHWGGEMGRLPVIQNEKNIGRDHNTYGFSQWMVGGGFRGGHIHGTTDEIGHKAVTDIVNHYDYHATLLHLFGLDPLQLAFRRGNGTASLLDGQPGTVVQALLS
ncbi:MAG: hypothetical protein RL215_1951 [Planctomycetota bacterium]